MPDIIGGIFGGGGGGAAIPAIPTGYTMKLGNLDGGILQIDSDLDNIHIRELPEIAIRLKEIPVMTINSNVAVKELPPINSNIAIKELPVIRLDGKTDVSISIKEVPETRMHLPAHYQIELSLFGFEILKLGFCGESQVISEKYVPRQAEICL
jgi:hypothetical protein